jgi:hypothetical protein
LKTVEIDIDESNAGKDSRCRTGSSRYRRLAGGCGRRSCAASGRCMAAGLRALVNSVIGVVSRRTGRDSINTFVRGGSTLPAIPGRGIGIRVGQAGGMAHLALGLV